MKGSRSGRNGFSKEFEKLMFSLVEELNELKNLDSKQEKNLRQCANEIVDFKRRNHITNNIIAELDALILASHFIMEGYTVYAERPLTIGPKPLVADIFAEKGGLTEIIEVESGNVPSYYVLNPRYKIPPELYHASRIISKAARYSEFAQVFNFAFTAAPPIELGLVRPYLDYLRTDPAQRKAEDTREFVGIANMLYSSPKIRTEQVKEGRLNKVYRVNNMKRSAEQIYPPLSRI